MGAERNAQMVRSAYRAFSAGDTEALVAMFAEDAVWHVSGHGGLAGTKLGRTEILGYFGELFQRSAGTLELSLHDVVGGDDHTVGLHENSARRAGNILRQRVVLVVHFRNELFTEVWEFHEDQAQYDAFWGDEDHWNRERVHPTS